MTTKSDGWYVDSSVIATDDSQSPIPALKNCKIWTRRFKSHDEKRIEEPPLVMIHGMGAGLGFFSLNFDKIVKERTVYAIDLPGTNCLLPTVDWQCVKPKNNS